MTFEGTGPRVFPELNSPHPTQTESANYDKVKLVVSLKQAVPPGFVANVDAKVFDPDHAHTPTDASDQLDPNDYFNPDVPSPVTTIANDNRQSSGDVQPDGTFGFGARVGATLAETSLAITTGNQKTITMTIQDIQPGNNFKAVVLPTRHAINSVQFRDDGVSFKYKWQGNAETPIPSLYTTEILTVWRTLWIESDSWSAPSPSVLLAPSVDGPFDGDDGAEDDPNPGDVPNAPLDLLPDAYLAANIIVKSILPADDEHDNVLFVHNFSFDPMDVPNTNIVVGLLRDVTPKREFWVINIISAYEGPEEQDFDDEEDALLGKSVVANNVCFVFLETIRDRAAYQNPLDVLNPPSVDKFTLAKRVVLQETGHVMGLRHASGAVMLVQPNNLYGNYYENMFTNSQLGRIQGQAKPSTFVFE